MLLSEPLPAVPLPFSVLSHSGLLGSPGMWPEGGAGKGAGPPLGNCNNMGDLALKVALVPGCMLPKLAAISPIN